MKLTSMAFACSVVATLAFASPAFCEDAYIENANGNQYFNTGHFIGPHTRIEIDLQLLEITGQIRPFGVDGGGSGPVMRLKPIIPRRRGTQGIVPPILNATRSCSTLIQAPRSLRCGRGARRTLTGNWRTFLTERRHIRLAFLQNAVMRLGCIRPCRLHITIPPGCGSTASGSTNRERL